MRAGEIVALEWADVDLERRQISIRHSDWRGQLTSPKNGRGRFVAMTYVAGGRQFIVVAISGGSYSGEYVAFALPR